MTLGKLLRELAKVVDQEAAQNPQFAQRIDDILERALPKPSGRTPAGERAGSQDKAGRKGHRRAPAVLDPVALAAEGESLLRKELSSLSLDELKDIVAEHGMDPGKLVMKWKTPEKIIDKIVELSLSRARKGDAFRTE